MVLDDFYDPRSRLAEYDAIADLGPLRVVLLPHLDVARERSRTRGPGPAEYIADGIHEVYALIGATADRGLAGWTVLDNSRETPEQTRDRILALA